MRMRIPSSAVKPLVRLQLLFAQGSHPSSSLKSKWVALRMVMVMKRMVMNRMVMNRMVMVIKRNMSKN